MVHPTLSITLGAHFTHFHVLCDRPLLDGKTTAISKSRYYAWKICKIWWKVIAGRIWWWDEIEWQKCAPSVINNVGRTPKNATVKNFTSTDFLGPIRFDSPNGGTSNSRIKKKTWTLPLKDYHIKSTHRHSDTFEFNYYFFDFFLISTEQWS